MYYLNRFYGIISYLHIMKKKQEKNNYTNFLKLFYQVGTLKFLFIKKIILNTNILYKYLGKFW